MLGATHGTAGIAIGAAGVLGLRAAGMSVSATEAAVLIATAAVAAEVPDIDLGVSRISKGASSLTALPYVGYLTVLLTLPIVLAGFAVRAVGVRHRHQTHSIPAAAAFALVLVPVYSLYWVGLGEVASFVGHQVVDAYAPGRSLPFDRWAEDLARAWSAMAVSLATVALLAYLSHLLLDMMTTAPVQLFWPFSDRMYELPAPSIRVGSTAEAAVALPISLLAVWLVWTVAKPSVPEIRVGSGPPVRVLSSDPGVPPTRYQFIKVSYLSV